MYAMIIIQQVLCVLYYNLYYVNFMLYIHIDIYYKSSYIYSTNLVPRSAIQYPVDLQADTYLTRPSCDSS